MSVELGLTVVNGGERPRDPELPEHSSLIRTSGGGTRGSDDMDFPHRPTERGTEVLVRRSAAPASSLIKATQEMTTTKKIIMMESKYDSFERAPEAFSVGIYKLFLICF